MRASWRSFATACSSALLLLACSRAPSASEGGAPVPSAGPLASVASLVPPPSAAPSTAPSASAQADPLLTDVPVKSKSIGHTSYVLKVTLSGGAVMVFKPRSRLPLGDRRYRGEIAAYRIAVALGLDNVPRSFPRSFDASALRPLQPDFDEKALVDADGKVRGAAKPWLDKYVVLPLEQPSARARWEPWLTDPAASIPDEQRALAGAVSTMIAFDYITGNWDRWSGGNIAQDGATGTVLYVDNDGAFYDPPPADSLARQLAMLRRIVRFSRRFLAMLRALADDKLRTAIGEEAAGQPLLPERVVSGVAARRKTVVDLVDARIGSAGQDATLALP